MAGFGRGTIFLERFESATGRKILREVFTADDIFVPRFCKLLLYSGSAF